MDLYSLSIELLMLLFGADVVAGFVDSIAGGGGLAMSRGVGIIRPIYLSVVFITIVRLLSMNFFPSS